MNLESLKDFDFSALLGNSDSEFATQIAEDWDAIVRMFAYLIEFFTSLFA